MANTNTGKIKAIHLTSKNNAEALEIVNTIAEADNRSGTYTAETLIAKAGKERAERIKAAKTKG